MTEPEFLLLKSEILQLLEDKLDPRLTYHCKGHTADVLRQSERIAKEEGITDERLLLLIKVAALFHDTGFLYTYKDHEQRSCKIMVERIGSAEFDGHEIEMMANMILATKVPQSPATLPEMILCDADLDYLGRNDFDKISGELKEEFLTFGIVKDDDAWDSLQVKFFEQHHYFTSSSVADRDPVKMKHLKNLRRKLPG